MFDKLEDLLIRFEEIMGELHEPTVTNNQERFRKLMKEQSDLTPIVDAYTEYKKCKQDIEDSLSMLEEEKDEEMREMIKETLNDSKKRVEELEQELKILLLPKDPNDDKNVIVEIRAGAGGDEAALFAAEIYRMYVHYAEKQRWKVELINVDEIGIGGMKEVQFTISGWVKFVGTDGNVTTSGDDAADNQEGSGARVDGFLNVDTKQVEFIVDYNMMNVRTETFLQEIDKSRIDRFEEEFAQYEKDLEEAKKEQGKA